MQTTTCLRYLCVLIAATSTTHSYANDVARVNSLCAPNPDISLDCVRAHQQDFEKLYLKGEIPPSAKLKIGKRLLGLYFLQSNNSAQLMHEEDLITQRIPVYRAAENAIETASGETVSATSQATYLAEARASEAVFLSHDHSIYGPDIKYAKSQIKRYSPHKSFSLGSKLLVVDALATGAAEGYIAAANRQPLPQQQLGPSPAQLAVAAQTAAPATPQYQTVTTTAQSPQSISGVGANWSGPYTLCAYPPGSGYRPLSDQFVLSGDRTCGKWAICQRTAFASNEVCWQFDLQGHNERPYPGQAYSQGWLSVVWTNQP